jgi:hypothetical protein
VRIFSELPGWLNRWIAAIEPAFRFSPDGAEWIWNLADQHFPGAVQIVDLYHARQPQKKRTAGPYLVGRTPQTGGANRIPARLCDHCWLRSMLVYACTIFLGAFLLFEVQPMIGKIILPWFGGSGAVWSTCLLFFQAALLAGYLYAHISTRYLKPRQQAILHIALMAASLAVLPIIPSAYWKPSHPGDPSGRILLLLAATVGLPYMLLSTTSPLLQAWYVAAKPGAIPYRLFALSNFGSLLALFSYPALLEPWLPTRAQAVGWSVVYGGFVVLCSAVAWKTFRGPVAAPVENVFYPPAEISPQSPAPGWTLHILWTALAACASALLLGFTNHMSHNVAPIPFLWVLPLGAYLLSFILCFESEKIYQRVVFLPALLLALGASAYAIYFDQSNPPIKLAVPLFCATLFICCMVCHGELVRLKPDPRHLTSFYLMISLGGALGGLFVDGDLRRVGCDCGLA